MAKNSKIGFLQGRLTQSGGRGVQFFPFEEWEDELSLARGIGFSSIELLVKGGSYNKNPLWSQKGREQIKKLAQENNISIPSVHGFTLKSPEYTQAATNLVCFSHDVGAKTILFSFFKDNKLESEKDKQEARERLEGAVTLAEELGVKLAIEAEMPMVELLSFVDSFSSSAVGIYYDIGNMVSMNVDVAEEIELAGDKIFGVHIKDRTKNGGPSVLIGEGDSDFVSVFGALSRVGYKGPYIIQGARYDQIDDITLNKRYYNFVKEKLDLV